MGWNWSRTCDRRPGEAAHHPTLLLQDIAEIIIITPAHPYRCRRFRLSPLSPILLLLLLLPSPLPSSLYISSFLDPCLLFPSSPSSFSTLIFSFSLLVLPSLSSSSLSPSLFLLLHPQLLPPPPSSSSSTIIFSLPLPLLPSPPSSSLPLFLLPSLPSHPLERGQRPPPRKQRGNELLPDI